MECISLCVYDTSCFCTLSASAFNLSNNPSLHAWVRFLFSNLFMETCHSIPLHVELNYITQDKLLQQSTMHMKTTVTKNITLCTLSMHFQSTVYLHAAILQLQLLGFCTAHAV